MQVFVMGFMGLPINVIQRLQFIQNSAARVLTRTKKNPPKPSIQFKILLLVYKALASLAHTHSISQTCGQFTIPASLSGHKVEISSMCLGYFQGLVRWHSAFMTLRNRTVCLLNLNSLNSSFKTKLKMFLFSQVFS